MEKGVGEHFCLPCPFPVYACNPGYHTHDCIFIADLTVINIEFYDFISQFSPEVSNNRASLNTLKPFQKYSTVHVFSTPFLVF